jgi:RNA polymerase sigma-70 factor (ECF subfamily)
MPFHRRKYHSLSDDELYRLLVSGSERERNDAFDELYHRHSGRVFIYCARILGDQTSARDACQEVFIAFWRSVSSERVMTNLRGYLLRIARNICLLMKRNDSYITATEFEENLVETENPLGEAAIEQNELAEILAMALELLPEHYRQAVVLQCYNGLTYQEIADVLGVPLSTARNWIVRAKAHLRTILEPYWQDRSSQSTDEETNQMNIQHQKHHG